MNAISEMIQSTKSVFMEIYSHGFANRLSKTVLLICALILTISRIFVIYSGDAIDIISTYVSVTKDYSIYYKIESAVLLLIVWGISRIFNVFSFYEYFHNADHKKVDLLVSVVLTIQDFIDVVFSIYILIGTIGYIGSNLPIDTNFYFGWMPYWGITYLLMILLYRIFSENRNMVYKVRRGVEMAGHSTDFYDIAGRRIYEGDSVLFYHRRYKVASTRKKGEEVHILTTNGKVWDDQPIALSEALKDERGGLTLVRDEDNKDR